MTFNYKDKEYNYPNSLKDITLKQRIELHVQYGISFEEKAKKIAEIEDIT